MATATKNPAATPTGYEPRAEFALLLAHQEINRHIGERVVDLGLAKLAPDMEPEDRAAIWHDLTDAVRDHSASRTDDLLHELLGGEA